ncbi:MAG: CDP-alcohol phosphatidyltransferase family protein [Lysobacteraceae bacterium]
MNLRQLPNAITCIRMLLVLPLVWGLHVGDYRMTLVVALTAGVSDALDGWLAKHFGWQTWLGGVLDPVADKLLLDASFIGLWMADAIPGWLAALVVGRDVVIVAGASAYHFLIGRLEGKPTLLSKTTTVAQIAMVLALLVGLAWRPLPANASIAMDLAIATLTFASGIDYVVRWSLRAYRASQARHG